MATDFGVTKTGKGYAASGTKTMSPMAFKAAVAAAEAAEAAEGVKSYSSSVVKTKKGWGAAGTDTVSPMEKEAAIQRIAEVSKKGWQFAGTSKTGTPIWQKVTPEGYVQRVAKYDKPSEDVTGGSYYIATRQAAPRQQKQQIFFGVDAPEGSEPVKDAELGEIGKDWYGYNLIRHYQPPQQQEPSRVRVQRSTISSLKPFDKDAERVTSFEEYLKYQERKESPGRAAIFQPAESWIENLRVKSVDAGFFSSYARFGVGLLSVPVQLAKSAAHPVKTVKGAAYAVTHPSEAGQAIGEHIDTKGADFFGGELLGYYLTGRVAGAGATKTKNILSGKTTQTKVLDAGKTEVFRGANLKKGTVIEEAGASAKVEVFKKVGRFEFGKKVYDVGVTSEKQLKIGSPTYSYQTVAMVKGKQLDIFAGAGQGKISMSRIAQATKPTNILGQPVTSSVSYVYRIGGKEVGSLKGIGSYKGIDAVAFKPHTSMTRRFFGGELAEVHYPKYNIIHQGRKAGMSYKGQYVLKDTVPVDPKFLSFEQSGMSGLAKTDYIISSRQSLMKLKGAAGETRAVTSYDIIGSGRARLEHGIGKTKGVSYPGAVKKNELVLEYSVPGSWDLMTRPGKQVQLRVPDSFKMMMKTKKGQSQLVSNVKPVVKSRVTKTFMLRPPASLIEEGAAAAKLSYAQGRGGIGFVPVATTPTIAQTQLASSSFETRASAMYKPVSAPAFKLRSSTSHKTLLKPVQKPVMKPAEKLIEKPVQKLMGTPVSKPITKIIQKPTQKLMQKPLVKTIQKPVSRAATTMPVTPFLPPKPLAFPKGISPRKERGFVEGFDVLVKSFGKWKKANIRPLPKESALSKGARAVEGTSAATFKIMPKGMIKDTAKKDMFFALMKHKFRSKKAASGEILRIEKNVFRIDTSGELAGITFKGLDTLRDKKRRIDRKVVSVGSSLAVTIPFREKYAINHPAKLEKKLFIGG